MNDLERKYFRCKPRFSFVGTANSGKPTICYNQMTEYEIYLADAKRRYKAIMDIHLAKRFSGRHKK